MKFYSTTAYISISHLNCFEWVEENSLLTYVFIINVIKRHNFISLLSL